MSGIRIALVTDPQPAIALGAVQAYVQRHQLAWQISVIDQAGWRLASMQAELALAGFAGAMGWSYPPQPSWLEHAPIPRVLWTGHDSPPGPAAVHLGPDDAATGRLAARHFRDQGLRHVAVVRHWRLAVRQTRYASFLAEAAALGLGTLVYEPSEELEREAQLARLADWLRNAPHPLGVFLHQDRDALSLLLFCQEQGLAIPDQVAVLGVDDLPAAATSVPALSSIAWPVSLIATTMAARLHRLLAGADRGGLSEMVAPMRVVARASTGPCSSGDALIDALRLRLAAKPGRGWRGRDLAAATGLSRAQLHRRFRAACGSTPGAELQRHRIRLAQDLLAEGRLPVAEVARRCGLRTSAGLWKSFQRAGLPPPSAWRA